MGIIRQFINRWYGRLYLWSLSVPRFAYIVLMVVFYGMLIWWLGWQKLVFVVLYLLLAVQLTRLFYFLGWAGIDACGPSAIGCTGILIILPFVSINTIDLIWRDGLIVGLGLGMVYAVRNNIYLYTILVHRASFKSSHWLKHRQKLLLPKRYLGTKTKKLRIPTIHWGRLMWLAIRYKKIGVFNGIFSEFFYSTKIQHIPIKLCRACLWGWEQYDKSPFGNTGWSMQHRIHSRFKKNKPAAINLAANKSFWDFCFTPEIYKRYKTQIAILQKEIIEVLELYIATPFKLDSAALVLLEKIEELECFLEKEPPVQGANTEQFERLYSLSLVVAGIARNF